jgi:hypothetical protein
MKKIKAILATLAVATCLQANQSLTDLIQKQDKQPQVASTTQTLYMSSEFQEIEENAQKYFKSNSAILGWDLHNVLVTRTKKTFAKGGFGNFGSSTIGFKEKARLYGQLAHALANPFVWTGIKGLIKSPYGKNKITESYFNMLHDKGYNLLFNELIKFSNNIFVETPEMTDLLNEIETTTDHNHFLFSNIGSSTLEDIHTRKLFPNIFNGKRFLENGINSYYPHTSNGVYTVWKSKPEAYSGFEKYTKCSDDKKCSIIFIDDKLKNVKGAPKEWNCILFKSVEQLKKDLVRLGILEIL